MKKIYAVLSLAVLSMLAVPTCFAAYNQDLIDAATSTATTVQENALEAIPLVVNIAIIPGVLILVIFLAWRLARKFLGGK